MRATSALAFAAVVLAALTGPTSLALAQEWVLTKEATPTTYTKANQLIHYTYRIQDTSGGNGHIISITDDKAAPINCPSTSVPPFGTLVCTASYKTTAADLTNGSITNTVHVIGDSCNDGCDEDLTASATVTFTPQPSWTLNKSANPTTYTHAGQTIHYIYLLKNTGNVSISSISLTDDKAGSVSCPSTTLAAGASMTCSTNYSIKAADVTAGSVTNAATATGTPAAGSLAPATDQATVTFAPQPSWTLAKSANPKTFSGAGQTIHYSYVLTNTGNVTITTIKLTDDKVATVSCPATTLTAGAKMTCTGNYSTTTGDVAARSITNTATATGTPASGTLAPVTDTATVTFSAPPAGSITIVKTATGGNESFNFTSSLPSAASFTLVTSGGKASRTFSNLQPGTYTFTETNLPLHWKLTSLSCTGDTGGRATTTSVSSRTVTVGLDGGEAITCTFGNVFDKDTHIKDTTDVIRRFLSHRMQLLIDHEPDRPRLIRRLPGSLWDGGGTQSASAATSPFNVAGGSDAFSSQISFSTSMSQIAQAQANADARGQSQQALAYAPGDRPLVKAWPRAAPTSNVDIWFEGHLSQFKANAGGIDNSGHFGVLYLGADYLINPSFLIGALVQVDSMTESSKAINSDIGGTGAMAGPYVSARIWQNFFFDARVAYGFSDNKVNPFGLYQDKFSTDRWLGNARLTGNWTFGDFRVTPSAAVTYIQEHQHSYIDGLGVGIPSQTVTLGRFNFGPEFAYRYLAASGVTYEPQLSIKGVWDFERPDLASIDGIVISPNEFHVMTQLGLMARSPSGFSLRVSASYDGLGSSSWRDIGGQVWLNVPFN